MQFMPASAVDPFAILASIYRKTRFDDVVVVVVAVVFYLAEIIRPLIKGKKNIHLNIILLFISESLVYLLYFWGSICFVGEVTNWSRVIIVTHPSILKLLGFFFFFFIA